MRGQKICDFTGKTAEYTLVIKHLKTLKVRHFDMSTIELKKIGNGKAWKEMQKPKKKRYSVPTR